MFDTTPPVGGMGFSCSSERPVGPVPGAAKLDIVRWVCTDVRQSCTPVLPTFLLSGREIHT